MLLPHLIDQIIEDANFQLDTKFKTTPAASTKILNKDEGGMPHHAQWHYRELIGKLNFSKNQPMAIWVIQSTSVQGSMKHLQQATWMPFTKSFGS